MRARHTVHIIEVGYCSDHRMQEKCEEKAQQHAQLAAGLRAAGWLVEYEQGVHTVALGHWGAVPKTLDTLLPKFGLRAAAVNAAVDKLGINAVVHADVIRSARINQQWGGRKRGR